MLYKSTFKIISKGDFSDSHLSTLLFKVSVVILGLNILTLHKIQTLFPMLQTIVYNGAYFYSVHNP